MPVPLRGFEDLRSWSDPHAMALPTSNKNTIDECRHHYPTRVSTYDNTNSHVDHSWLFYAFPVVAQLFPGNNVQDRADQSNNLSFLIGGEMQI